jgi:hypothetical protein
MYCCLLSFSAAISAEIYKWVDENGKVHYSDKPFNENAEKVTIEKPPTEKQRIEAQNNAKRLIQRDKRLQENKIEDQQLLKQQTKEINEKSKICADAKKELEILMTPVRVYQVDENGNESILDDAQRQINIKHYKEEIENNCDD